MAGETVPKIRLVRCPKCRLVLQEVPDFPVYKCGGCDTILVAKNRKSVADTTSALRKTDDAGPDNDHYEKVPSPSSNSDCEKLDENGSNKGQQFQVENCNENVAKEDLEAETKDNLQDTSETNLTVSDNLLEQPRKTELHVFHRLSTFETADFGSLSASDDGMYDEKLHSFKRSYNKAADYRFPQETRPRGKLPVNGSMNGNHYATQKYSMSHQDEPLEPVMHHHHPPRDRPRLDIPFSRKVSSCGYASAGPSHESRDEFPFDSNLYRLEKIESTEQENMKLLRMVHELQEQISKSCHLNGRPSTDAPLRQNHFPTYEDGYFYPRHHGRHGQNSSWSQQSRSEHTPFTGGGINTRYSIDNSSCLQQLHLPIFRRNRELCRADTGYSCYSSHSSCPSSTQTHFESGFSNQRYMREKHHSVRRHLRPTAGGAPFVACYNCFTPLQLPADFLLFKRKLHQLRCGACAKVLKFSFLEGIHIVPYETVDAEPPPSDVVNAKISTLASCSHGILQADTMSYSDDGDPVSHTEHREDIVLKQSQTKHTTPMEAFDSADPSSNLSSSGEVLPPRTGGKSLHHLMGYSSPDQLINGLISSISGTSSVHSSETSD